MTIMITMIDIIVMASFMRIEQPLLGLHSICHHHQGDEDHKDYDHDDGLEVLVDEDEDGEHNLEIELNHVIDVNALVDLRAEAVLELFWVFIQSTFQCASANLHPEGELNAVGF